MSGHRKLAEQQVYAGLMARAEYLRFAECGLSSRVITSLIKAGIDTPERLLSMAPDQIELIRGIGPTLAKEIEAYRTRSQD